MNKVLHKADTRGHADHGWLDTHHTFSFASYYDPERVHFGVLRVLNDDIVQPGMGFGKHPHENMEIISIPIKGALEHKDSMDNIHVIKENDIQAMSAGTGIYHSEYNHSKDSPVNFLQIWIFPDKKDVQPRYQQLTFTPEERKNKIQQVLSPDPDDEGVWIHQRAWFFMGNLEEGFESEYKLKENGNGVYAFVINGGITVADETLYRRDGLGIWDTDIFKVRADSNTELLLMEVPMTV